MFDQSHDGFLGNIERKNEKDGEELFDEKRYREDGDVKRGEVGDEIERGMLCMLEEERKDVR